MVKQLKYCHQYPFSIEKHGFFLSTFTLLKFGFALVMFVTTCLYRFEMIIFATFHTFLPICRTIVFPTTILEVSFGALGSSHAFGFASKCFPTMVLRIVS